MDRTRLLEKIKKCLAMANDGRGNSAEAAVALGQAQKLMSKFGVTDSELGAVGYGNEKVAFPIQANKKVPLVLTELVHLIMKAFGVDCVVETEVRVSDRSYCIRYFGKEDRVMLAAYSSTVVYRAMMGAWTAHLKANPYLKGDRGARAGFCLGWLDAVREQIVALGMTESEAAQTKLVKETHYGHALSTSKVSKISVQSGTMSAGEQVGADFKLHRPMQADKLKIGR